MSDRTQLIVYLVGFVVAAGCIFWDMLGHDETGRVIAGTIFGGMFWPIVLVFIAFGALGTGIDSLNTRRRATLTARDAAKAETEQWLKDGDA